MESRIGTVHKHAHCRRTHEDGGVAADAHLACDGAWAAQRLRGDKRKIRSKKKLKKREKATTNNNQQQTTSTTRAVITTTAAAAATAAM